MSPLFYYCNNFDNYQPIFLIFLLIYTKKYYVKTQEEG